MSEEVRLLVAEDVAHGLEERLHHLQGTRAYTRSLFVV